MNITDMSIDMTLAEQQSLNKYMSGIVGYELTRISSACYMPKFIRYKKDFMFKTGVNKKDIQAFKKSLGSVYSKFRLLADEFTLIMLMYIIYSLKNNYKESAKLCCHLLSIKFYGSLLHVSFPRFCSDQLWHLALSQISPKHLFRDRNGIANAILYISEAVLEKFSDKMSRGIVTDTLIINFIFEIRTRISQSIKSFAETYYDLQKRGVTSVAGEDYSNSADNLTELAEKISISMCTYEQVDSKSVEFAISRSGINRDIGESLVTELSNIDYKSDIKFIIILLGNISPYKNICKERSRLAVLRKVNANVKISGYSIKDRVLNMMYNTSLGFRLKPMNKTQLVNFFIQYLTKYIQFKIC